MLSVHGVQMQTMHLSYEQRFRFWYEVLRRAAIVVQHSMVMLLLVPVVDHIVSQVTSWYHKIVSPQRHNKFQQ